MRYLIDTNIFLRTLVKEDPHSFKDCSMFLESAKKNAFDVVTTSLILSEVVWTLSSFYKFAKLDVIRALRGIIHTRGLQIVDRYTMAAALISYEMKSVKFIDAMIGSIPEVIIKQWVVVSYDRDFDKLDVLRKEPGDIVQEN